MWCVWKSPEHLINRPLARLLYQLLLPKMNVNISPDLIIYRFLVQLTNPTIYSALVLYMIWVFYSPFITTMFSPGPTLFNTWLIMLLKKTKNNEVEFHCKVTVFILQVLSFFSTYIWPSKQIFGPTTLAAPLVICRAKRSGGQTLERLHFGSGAPVAEKCRQKSTSDLRKMVIHTVEIV